jgi:hypothetical protein
MQSQFSARYFRLIGILASLILLGSPSLASAIEYGGFGGRPAYPREDNARTESIFIHTLEPGITQKEGVKVVNNTQEKKTFIIYGSDSTPSTDGAFACKQFVEEKNDVGAWIELNKTEVTMDPGTNQIIPFTITVPKNASVGEHNGCILIQEKKEAPKEDQAGMSLSVRTGIRVAITIPGDLERKLEIAGFTLDRTETGFTLHPQVKNTGNVSIDADARVTTRYFFGPTLIKHGGQYPILRGDTSDWSFELKHPFWGGLYRSQFTVEYDDSKGASVGVQTDKKLTMLKSSNLWFWSMPTWAGLAIEIIILLCIAAVIYLVRLSQKRKQWINLHWVTHTLTTQTDIVSLASDYDVSWKLLSQVNQLKPPYTLKVGDVLRVPPILSSSVDAPKKVTSKTVRKKPIQ